MRTFLFLPPVRRPTGGVAVILRLAEVLHRSGRQTALVARERAGWIPGESADRAPVILWEDLALGPGDLWLVPEGWVNALAPGLEAKARCLVYCQNWAYLFSALPEGVQWSRLPVEFLAVSDPVAWFMEQALGRRPAVLRPGIDLARFRPPAAKPQGKPRVAFMPRKNKALAQQIRAVFGSRNGPGRLDWRAIDGLDAPGVAQALQEAHLFSDHRLSRGLPPAAPGDHGLRLPACGLQRPGGLGLHAAGPGIPALRALVAPARDPLVRQRLLVRGRRRARRGPLSGAVRGPGRAGRPGPERPAGRGPGHGPRLRLEAFEAAVLNVWAQLER